MDSRQSISYSACKRMADMPSRWASELYLNFVCAHAKMCAADNMVAGVDSGRFKFHVYIFECLGEHLVAIVVGDVLVILGA